jgi:hypothetical protein
MYASPNGDGARVYIFFNNRVHGLALYLQSGRTACLLTVLSAVCASVYDNNTHIQNQLQGVLQYLCWWCGRSSLADATGTV